MYISPPNLVFLSSLLLLLSSLLILPPISLFFADKFYSRAFVLFSSPFFFAFLLFTFTFFVFPPSCPPPSLSSPLLSVLPLECLPPRHRYILHHHPLITIVLLKVHRTTDSLGSDLYVRVCLMKYARLVMSDCRRCSDMTYDPAAAK